MVSVETAETNMEERIVMEKRVKKRFIIKKGLSLLVVLAIVTTSLHHVVIPVPVRAAETAVTSYKHNLTEGSVTITSGTCGSSCPGHVITGSYVFSDTYDSLEYCKDRDYIKVESGTHSITIQDITIDYAQTAGHNGYNEYEKSAMKVAAGATVNLNVSGSNTLKGGYGMPGICVEEGATLNINGSGSLYAYGGDYAPGIGGMEYERNNEKTDILESIGVIKIQGGYIEAYGGEYAAGIGGGYCTNDYEVVITGGTVYATGGESGAGIGGGFIGYYTSQVGSIVITGGNIVAIGDTDEKASNIGNGYTPSTYGGGCTVKNTLGTAVYPVKLTLSGVTDGTEITSIGGLSGWGLTGVKTVGETLMVCAPAGTTLTSVMTKGGQEFKGSVTASTTGDVSGIFFLDVEPEANPTITLSDDLILGQSQNLLTYVMGNTSGAYTGTLHIVGGSKTDCNIGVKAGTHSISLDNVETDLTSVSSSRRMQDGSPLYVESGASVDVTLIGTTKLTPGEWAAAVQVVDGAKATFGGSGKLYGKTIAGATDFANDGYGAVIGAGYDGGCGEIVINSGNYYLRSNGSGAGIGGGGVNSQYAGGNVIINGGNINIEVTKEDAQKIGYGSNGANNFDVPDSGTLKNDANEDLYLTTITLVGLSESNGVVSITGTQTYNTSGMQVLDGKLCLYLPGGESITSVKVGDQIFTGTLTTTTSETSVVFKAKSIPTVENPVVNLDSDIVLSKEGSDLYIRCNSMSCKYTGTVTVSGDTKEHGIIVESGEHKLVLNNVNIDQQVNPSGNVIDIAGGATLQLTLMGENKLYAHDKKEAIRVPVGATLQIFGNGSLDALGRPAIGCYTEELGTIVINNGKISATGEFGAPAIGSGYEETSGGGSIRIQGGTISAIAGEYSAGIGTGGCSIASANKATGIDIVIHGGNIYAKGSTYSSSVADNIGDGNGGSGTTVKNSNDKELTVTEFTLSEATPGTSVTALTLSSETDTYSVTGMVVLADEESTNGKVYVYLPSGVSVKEIKIGDMCYRVPSDYAGETLSPVHNHKWKVSSSGDTLTAVCTEDVGVCVSQTNTVQVVAPAEDELVYNGSEKSASLLGTIPEQSLKIQYQKQSKDAWSDMSDVPVDAGNYRAYVALDGQVAYTEYAIQAAEVEIAELPTASTITYNQTLLESLLTGGKGQSNGSTIEGTFAWKSPNIKPFVSDSNVTKYIVIFSPVDSKNYKTAEIQLSLEIRKAANPENIPGNTINCPFSNGKVEDVELPECWKWAQEDASIQLEVGESVHATAYYDGADKGNYETEIVEIMITRSECEHAKTEYRDAVAAKCTEKGYTGDVYCADVNCGVYVRKGNVIPALGHAWDAGVVIKEATVTEKGRKSYTCKLCKKTKTGETPALGVPAVGTTVISDDGTAIYKITVSDLTKGTVAYVAPTDKNWTTVTIPNTVTIDGVIYKVTAIEKNAFYGCKKLKTVKIGKNVKMIGAKAFYKCKKLKAVTIGKKVRKIGKKAFYGCSKLKKLIIKSTKLTKKRVGKKAFGKTPKRMTVKILKKKFKLYKSMLIKRGVNKKAKFKKR